MKRASRLTGAFYARRSTSPRPGRGETRTAAVAGYACQWCVVSERVSGTVTFLFTDIEGSTSSAQSARAVIVTRLCSRGRRSGSIRVSVGERAAAASSTRRVTLSSPPSEARVTQPCGCGGDAQRALAENEWPGGAAVSVRMGTAQAASPKPVRSDTSGLGCIAPPASGPRPTAARCSLSERGRVLVEDDLPEGWFPCGTSGYTPRLKDIDRLERIWQLDVRRPRPLTSRRFAGAERIEGAALAAGRSLGGRAGRGDRGGGRRSRCSRSAAAARSGSAAARTARARTAVEMYGDQLDWPGRLVRSRPPPNADRVRGRARSGWRRPVQDCGVVEGSIRQTNSRPADDRRSERSRLRSPSGADSSGSPNSLDGTVGADRPEANGGQVVDKIPVGNGPTGARLRARRGLGGELGRPVRSCGSTRSRAGAGRPISVDAGADAIAAGDGAVWVTSEGRRACSRGSTRRSGA